MWPSIASGSSAQDRPVSRVLSACAICAIGRLHAREKWSRTRRDGLWFIGFVNRPSLIGYVGKQSRKLAKQIAAN
jgi:hypothetical protein